LWGGNKGEEEGGKKGGPEKALKTQEEDYSSLKNSSLLVEMEG